MQPSRRPAIGRLPGSLRFREMAAHGALGPARLDPRAVANCPTPDSHYGTRHGRVGGTGSSNRVRAVRSAVAVGTQVSSCAPRTEPYVRLSRIRLPPDRK